mmetsp:Transcript_39275/g.76843  ORF Transcript_39275/g.76843 Transcript_39275/m.76843 type:complete len:224 (-) Transcript_39275:18-689(-)
MLLLVQLPPLALPLLNRLALCLEVLDLPVEVLLLRLQLHNLVLHVRLPLLCLQRLPHAKRHTALVQGLVRRNRHSNLVSHAQEQQPPLRAVDRDLPDHLVEGLAVQLLADRADARLACLPLLELAVQILLQVDDVEARCGRAGYVLHPQLPVLGPLARGEDGVQDVLCLRHRRGLLHLGAFLALGGRDQDWVVISNQRVHRRDHPVRCWLAPLRLPSAADGAL